MSGEKKKKEEATLQHQFEDQTVEKKEKASQWRCDSYCYNKICLTVSSGQFVPFYYHPREKGILEAVGTHSEWG